MKLYLLFALIAGALANPLYPDTCGFEIPPTISARIIGGQEAAPNQFPWLVAVSGGGYCTGSIYTDRWIITAAHCMRMPTVWIRAGIHNRFNMSETFAQERKSKSVHKSPHGDFALIELEMPLDLNDYVRPVCLPTLEDLSKGIPYPVNTTITGWGDTTFPESDGWHKLHFAKGVEVKLCHWTKKILCSDTHNGVAACFGDSGGPLNYEFEMGRYKQLGVAQFITSPRCINGMNGYARLSTHAKWMEEVTGIKFE